MRSQLPSSQSEMVEGWCTTFSEKSKEGPDIRLSVGSHFTMKSFGERMVVQDTHLLESQPVARHAVWDHCNEWRRAYAKRESWSHLGGSALVSTSGMASSADLPQPRHDKPDRENVITFAHTIPGQPSWRGHFPSPQYPSGVCAYLKYSLSPFPLDAQDERKRDKLRRGWI